MPLKKLLFPSKLKSNLNIKIGFEFWRQKSIEYVCHYVMDTLMASFLPICGRTLILISTCQHSKKKEKATFATVVVQEIYRRLFLTYGNFLTSFSRKNQERERKSQLFLATKLLKRTAEKKEQFFIIWLLAAAFCLILPKRKSNFLFLHFFFHSFYSPFPLHF